MRTLEAALAQWRPRTSLGAAKMLAVAAEILSSAELDPECAMSDGPVLEIVTSVRDALKAAEDVRLGPTRGAGQGADSR